MINASPRGAFLAYQGGRLEAAYTPDLADDIDDPDEIHRFEERAKTQCSSAADILKRTLETQIDGMEITRSTPESIGHKVIVLLWMLNSEKGQIAGCSLAEIASRIGCTRALLSHYAKEFEVIYGIHSRGMKGKEASEVFRDSSKQGWKTRREKNPQRDGLTYAEKLKLKLQAA